MDNVSSSIHLPDSHLAALPALREELEEQRSDRLAQLAELSDAVAGDAGENGSRDEVAETRAAKTRQLLTEIEAALIRMDEGAYGACHGCSTVIPLERLEIMPHARYCVACGRNAEGRRA